VKRAAACYGGTERAMQIGGQEPACTTAATIRSLRFTLLRSLLRGKHTIRHGAAVWRNVALRHLLLGASRKNPPKSEDLIQNDTLAWITKANACLFHARGRRGRMLLCE
jgi:hypothetical protein